MKTKFLFLIAIALLDIEKIDRKQMTYTLELFENDNFIANGMLVKTEIVK